MNGLRGNGYGSTDERSISPALPKLVPSPGAPRSTRATLRPRSCRCSAAETPTMPAPRTMTSKSIDDGREVDIGCEPTSWSERIPRAAPVRLVIRILAMSFDSQNHWGSAGLHFTICDNLNYARTQSPRSEAVRRHWTTALHSCNSMI
ncbi:hypothetical protein F01_480161 [Burkholderia cenocepacia]|nr:hypothetical protein F01_480161 [Burkholderia cenocepacia]